jgi:hypothetical protein
LPEPASPESAIGDVLALLMAGREAEGSDGAVRSCTPAIPRPAQQQLSPEESPHDDNHAPQA